MTSVLFLLIRQWLFLTVLLIQSRHFCGFCQWLTKFIVKRYCLCCQHETQYRCLHTIQLYIIRFQDLLFDLGDIDGFVTGGEVPSVRRVFRPEKNYFSQLRTVTLQKEHTMVQFLLLSVWNLSFTIIPRKSGKGAKNMHFLVQKVFRLKNEHF